jgi:hypothetical protein
MIGAADDNEERSGAARVIAINPNHGDAVATFAAPYPRNFVAAAELTTLRRIPSSFLIAWRTSWLFVGRAARDTASQCYCAWKVFDLASRW